MANFLGIPQSEWAGAQAFSSFATRIGRLMFSKIIFQRMKRCFKSDSKFRLQFKCSSTMGTIAVLRNISLDWVVPDDLKEQIPTRNQQHLFKGIAS